MGEPRKYMLKIPGYFSRQKFEREKTVTTRDFFAISIFFFKIPICFQGYTKISRIFVKE